MFVKKKAFTWALAEGHALDRGSYEGDRIPGEANHVSKDTEVESSNIFRVKPVIKLDMDMEWMKVRAMDLG